MNNESAFRLEEDKLDGRSSERDMAVRWVATNAITLPKT